MPVCPVCREDKPAEDFRSAGEKRIRYYYCRPCKNEYERRSKYRRRYGIEYEDVERIKAAQNHCCAICGVHESTQARGLHLDHDHATGTVRSLLCVQCNTAIGSAREDVHLLGKMISYLQAHARPRPDLAGTTRGQHAVPAGTA